MKGHCHDCPNRESGQGKRGAIRILSTGLVLAAVILCWSGDASAFRCNNGKGLVSQGDSKARVRIECGKPDDVERVKSVTRGRSQGETIDTQSGKLRDRVYAEETLAVEKWYYNCGENDFLYVLTFEGDILVKEDTAGRGTGPSRCTY